jgi:hypothetical protein
MTVESRSAFARRLGVHRSNITRAVQAGRIVLVPGGWVNVEASIERWYATRGGRTDVAARHAANRGSSGSVAHQVGDNERSGAFGSTSAQFGGQAPAHPGQDAAESGGRTRMKAETLFYENQSIKLDIALLRGLRYPVDAVQREALAIGATVRAAMERIVDQTAPRLAVLKTDLERRRLLDAELAQLRRSIKWELPRTLRRLRAAGAAYKNGGSNG